MTEPGENGAAHPVLIPPGQKPGTADPLANFHELPCSLVLEAPVTGFSVGSLMQLRIGSVIRTAAQQNEDLQLKANGQLVGMVEVDVVGNTLAVRLTGIA